MRTDVPRHFSGRVAPVRVVLLLVFSFAGAEAWSEVPSASGAKPLLLVVGHATSHGWKAVVHPAFVTRVVDPDIEPRLAAAYSRFAAVMGASGDPVYVVATSHMEPVAASVADASFLDRSAARWKSEPDAMIAEAGLAVRRFLLAGTAEPKVEVPDLRLLARGLRYDHIGGGIFRGTQCSIPRFDKSLSDQADYALLYIEAFRVSRDPLFADVARSTIDFVLSDLLQPNTMFAAGHAADSIVARKGPELLEGGQAVWQAWEIRQILGARAGDIVAFHFGVREEGNVAKECDPAGDFAGRNVLVPRSESETRARFSLTAQELTGILTDARARLRDVRSKRPKPAWNRAIVVAANARMVSALARAAILFVEPRYATAAARTIRTLASRKLAFSEYPTVIRALLDTYQATFDLTLLERALALQREQASLPVSSSVPEPVAALLPPLDDRAPAIESYRQVFIAGDLSLPATEALLRAAQSNDALILLGNTERTRNRISTLLPYLAGIGPIEKHPVATVCEQATCRTPTTDPAVLAAWLH